MAGGGGAWWGRALQTSLFGRLGEERVRLVGATDKVLLEAYHDLWATGPAEDRGPAGFFDEALQRHESCWLPKVATWHRMLEIMWVKHCLKQADKPGGTPAFGSRTDIFTEEPGTGSEDEAAGPGPLGLGPPPLQSWVNTEHPWVKEVLERMPYFVPTVMFRLCSEECYAPPRPRARPRRGRGRGVGVARTSRGG